MPVAAHGRYYGNLYLTEKYDADAFSDEDESLAATFASQAAVAIESALAGEHAPAGEEPAPRAAARRSSSG